MSAQSLTIRLPGFLVVVSVTRSRSAKEEPAKAPEFELPADFRAADRHPSAVLEATRTMPMRR